MENSYSDVIKDKRFPEDPSTGITKNSQPPNPVLMRNNPATGSSSGINNNKNHEIVPPPHNEARARAVNRLLRLLSEAKAKSARVNSISKKFLGALARSNALPTPQTTSKTVVPLAQYKGSIAIPLPGKRTSINSEPKDPDVENLEFNSQVINDSIDDMYSDDADFAEGTEDQIGKALSIQWKQIGSPLPISLPPSFSLVYCQFKENLIYYYVNVESELEK